MRLLLRGQMRPDINELFGLDPYYNALVQKENFRLQTNFPTSAMFQRAKTCSLPEEQIGLRRYRNGRQFLIVIFRFL